MSDDPILAALARIYTNLHADIEDLRVDVLAELRKTRTDIIAKIEGLRDDISVNSGAVDMARQVNDNTREDVKQMREQLSVMWRQLKKAEADIRELKREP